MKLTPEEQEHLAAIRKSKPNNFDYSRLSNAGRDFWFLLDVVNRLEAELNSARAILEDVGHGFNCAHAAGAWLKAHPEPEGKHVADPEAEAEQALEHVED